MDQIHKFIKCNGARGNKVLVDANRIRSVREFKENSTSKMITNIYLENPSALVQVIDPLDRIHDLLEDARKVDL